MQLQRLQWAQGGPARPPSSEYHCLCRGSVPWHISMPCRAPATAMWSMSCHVRPQCRYAAMQHLARAEHRGKHFLARGSADMRVSKVCTVRCDATRRARRLVRPGGCGPRCAPLQPLHGWIGAAAPPCAAGVQPRAGRRPRRRRLHGWAGRSSTSSRAKFARG
jgi:hypothetical protein